MGSIQKDGNTYLGFNINKLRLIGQGREGKVYLLPENKVLKVFYTINSCENQFEILQKGKNSRFFPTVFNHDKYSIIMGFVYGTTLSKYLKHNNLDKPLSIELVKLIDEFKHLQFTKLDMRLGHIFVQPDETVKIIDPRNSFTIVQPYPVSMMRGLRKHGVLKKFFNNIRFDYPDYYNYWRRKM